MLSVGINGQQVDPYNQVVSPKIGVNQLVIKYYGIEFSKEQRKQLNNVELELIYSVDQLGNPTLSEINGTSDLVIIDSLKNKTKEIGLFNPQINDGEAVSSIYFVRFTFPRYATSQRSFGMLQGYEYNEAEFEDFEYIIESGRRYDLYVGGMVNQFMGKPGSYLQTGGGMKIDLTYTDKNQLIYGMNMSMYGNRLKQKYPINSQREQVKAPPTLLVGLVFGKRFDQFSIQGEINIGAQNITKKLSENDTDWVQLNGWSPGVLVNYPIRFGKLTPTYYYGTPSLQENNINVHFGVRFMQFSIKEATGVMMELGVGYKLGMKGIQKYKLKDDFFEGK